MDENNGESIEDTIKTGIEKVIHICSEESIHQKLSHHIQELSVAKCRTTSSTSSILSESSNATELNRRVQTGEITPFEADLKKKSTEASVGAFNPTTGLLDLEKYLHRQAEVAEKKRHLKKSKPVKKKKSDECKIPKKKQKVNSQRPKLISHTDSLSLNCHSASEESCNNIIKSKSSKSSDQNIQNDSDSEYIPSDEQDDSDEGPYVKEKSKRKQICSETSRKKRILDDGDETLYKKRVETTDNSNEIRLRTVDNLFKIPQSIWKRLFEYQRVSVRWLWELHGRNLGGLLGDEMGLGKTVQIIAFFAGLDCSELLSDGGRFRGLGPTLIVCPATLIEQWIQHFHEWCPMLRVVTLHQSGTYRGEPEELIESMKPGGVLLTSYSGVLNNMKLLIPFQWHYVVLDEGHKIRNPEAKVTKVVKKFSTPHRLLLTGSPMQNSLKELWSLFDFILPGKLGTLDAFIDHCATPITRGGYSNASALQEATALQVATMLKDAIAPYILRRTKNDVKHHVNLPEKNEQVLFCSLTEEQTDLYKEFLRTENVSTIIHNKNTSHNSDGRHRAKLLVALTALRKICNHPDLYIYSQSNDDSDEDIDTNEDVNLDKFGHWTRSGKMTVVRSLLKIWKRQNHRVLLFMQGRQMMHILEGLIQNEKFNYLRLDGSTPMAERQRIIQKFNEDSSYFVFISTTRVGGLGINLTGADRVIIYDPDWNPATDSQARERAWRIGQDKRVTIYRLITAGTIEEKIYHRQIFKLLLSSRILDDPRQRRLFQTSDLTELFNLNEPINGETTESDRLFGNSKLNRNNIMNNHSQKKLASKNRRKERKEKKIAALFEGEEVSFLLGRRLGESKIEETSQVVDDDDYVLNKLFSKTTVNSALQHDTILSSVKMNSNTTTPMQRLARDSAEESMNFVRESRKWCWKPSWHNL